MEQQKTKKSKLEQNEMWFKVFHILPTIISITLAVAGFVLGIVLSSVWGADNDGGYEIYVLVFALAGCVLGGIFYALLKIAFSYKILHIEYLKKISGQKLSVNSDVEDIDIDELPTI